MKRLASFLTLLAFGACYTKPPPCDPSTIDWPRCIDPTQPALKEGAGAAKLGASLLYPGTTVYPTSIFGSTAAGRAMLTASNAAAQRALLGISDVGDLRNYAVADAISLLSLTRPQVVVDEAFNDQPGVTNSTFNAVGGTLAQSTQGEGGWFSLATAAGAASNAATHNNQRQILVTNPVAKKWYALFLFSVASAVNADTVLRLGLYHNTLGTANGVFLGVYGTISAGFFGFFQELAAVPSGVLSTVAVDLNVTHVGRIWADATGTVYGSMDFESAKSFAGTVTNSAMAHLQILNGAGGGVRTFAIGHAIYITE